MDPRNQSALYSAVSDHRHACAFVAGLPEHVRRLILQFLTNYPLDTKYMLKRARCIFKDDAPAGLIVTAAKIELRGTDSTSANDPQSGVNHSVRFRWSRRTGQNRSQQSNPCVDISGTNCHILHKCLGKYSTAQISASVSSPAQM